ncbi:hypothetical protein [Mammaliicoccus sciuri]|uniref:hypothetical protein n=1 Tax=Mammaliicoccus sciuri TaxID=1296 RepID=UPI001C3CE6E1|nr:hypothetical protein [Mammaliicoccus sciuri]MBV5103765.1 hypothetical protein [Mammaliicoccus sciuri]
MYEEHNFINLKNIPLNTKGKKSYYSWKDCNNTPADFRYKNTKGTLYITYKGIKTYGKKRVSLLEVEYKNLKQDMVSTMIVACKLGGLLKYKTKEYYYNVGDIINNSKVINQIYFEDKHGRTKGYEMLCLETNGSFKMREHNLKSGQRSPYLRGYLIDKGNSLYNEKSVLKYLKNENDAHKFYRRSAKLIDIECKSCGFEKKIRVNDLVDYGFTCPFCTKGISFPERYMSAILQLNSIDYEFQKTFPDLKRKRFDFYIPSINCVIEMNGMQHYEKNNFLDYTSTLKSDTIKKEYCENKGISFIPINSSISTFEYINGNVIGSPLNNKIELFNKEIVSQKMLDMFINENLTNIVNDYKSGMSYSSIVKKYELKDKYELISLIKKYGVYEFRNSSEISNKSVICLNDGKVFESVKSAREYGRLKTSSHIVQVCKKKRKTSGKHPLTGEPLKWMYYDEYLNQK